MDNLDLLETLNFLDLSLAGILLLSLILGVFRGLIREILSVASWVLALWLAQQHRHELTAYLPDWLKLETVPDIVKFSIVFLLSLVMLTLAAWIINKIVQISVPAVMNRMFGAGFGIIRGLLICTLLLYVAQNMAVAEPQFQSSIFASYFIWMMDWIGQVAPELWLNGQG